MKVYVIKRNDGTYYKRCIDSIIMFEKEISSAEFYLDKSRVEEIVHFIIKRKHLYNILPEELNIVEVQLMETTELTDYTKQVRKEVCDEIKNNSEIEEKHFCYDVFMVGSQERTHYKQKIYCISEDKLNEIQGE